jgi:hypothetical protein
MQTLAVPTKNVKAFYGFLDTEHGVFTMLDGVVVFMATETEELRVVERGMSWTTCGEIGVCETQQIMDRMSGGAAWIATHRAQEVA